MVAIWIMHLPAQLVVWLRWHTRRLVHRRALLRAVKAAYKPFARTYPQWVASFFDDHFLLVYAVPLLMDAWESGRHLIPAQLAAAWHAQFAPAHTFVDELHAGATRVAIAFLELLEAELDADPVLALFDEARSR